MRSRNPVPASRGARMAVLVVGVLVLVFFVWRMAGEGEVSRVPLIGAVAAVLMIAMGGRGLLSSRRRER